MNPGVLSRPGLARLCVGALLLFCMAAASPLGPALAALFGALDRDHQAIILAGRENVQIVLHHGSAQRAHHHGLLARGLTLFAQKATVPNPDHVLEFVNSVPLTLQSHTPREAGVERTIAVVELEASGENGSVLLFSGAPAAGPAPGLPASTFLLRSIELLI